MKSFTFNLAKLVMLCAILLIGQQQDTFAQFPCGGQILNACACDGAAVLVADSDPCTFNSAEQQTFLLVDEVNALITSDPDNGAIVNTSNSGVFFNVQTGDYVLYSLVYATSDEAAIQSALNGGISALQALGSEGPAGTWTSNNPSFTLISTSLATVNGPECNCPTFSVGNYIWSDQDFDGTQDPGEPGIGGVTVYLYEDADGDGVPDSSTPVATVVTNSSGFYGFADVPAGNYVIQIDLNTLPNTAPDGTPISFTPTPSGVGGNFGDSDFNSSGYTASFSLGEGESNLNFDAGFRPSIVSLATELISFEGKVTTEGNELSWATASETDNDYFSVMRSKDGISFNTAGTVDGAGNSSARINYIFLDKNASVGTSYYQLTNTDLSGKTAIVSKTISLTKELAGFELTDIRPIPAVEFVNIDFVSNDNKNIDIKVFNLAGQQMMNQVAEAQEGANALKLDIRDYAIGVYFIIITDGKDKLVGKFLKN